MASNVSDSVLVVGEATTANLQPGEPLIGEWRPAASGLFRVEALAQYLNRARPEGAVLRLAANWSRTLAQSPFWNSLPWSESQRRIPAIQQMQAADCGAACLAMVLAYHGKAVRLDEVRNVLYVDRDGVDALGILHAARLYGLRGRAVKLEVEDLDYLDTGSILHWDFSHFVVFERMQKESVVIVDPAGGRRAVPMQEFRASFTGVALLLEAADDFQPAAGATLNVWSYVRPILAQRSLLTRIGVASLLIQLFALALPLLMGLLVDRVVPQQDYNLLWLLGVGFVATIGFSTLASLLRSHLLLHLRTHLDKRMTLGFIEHLVELPYAFFERRSVGDLMMRVNSNAAVRELLTSSALSALLDGALVSVYLLLLFANNWQMAIVVLLLGMLQVCLFLLSQRAYRDLMAQDLQSQAKAEGYLVQMLAGIETLKAGGAEHRAVENWSNLFIDELNISLARGRLSANVDAAMGALRMGSPLLILVLGGFQVLSGQLSLGSMLALNALAVAFLSPLSTLVATGLQLQLVRSYLVRIDDVFQAEPEQKKIEVVDVGCLKGGIHLDNVSFRYGALAPYAVRDISLSIAPGQFVAIVGRSGAGKSTLASLLLGLYKPVAGQILYDGVDLNGVDVRSVRRQVGIVPQHPYLFGKSVRENIALVDPSLPMDAVVHAAQLAQIHDDIVAMPMGYETILADGGASLSGGQRQRIALARALVHQPAILLLDEATSALDTVTEKRVQEALSAQRSTRIVIAQRLSTVRQADLILVMEGGRVVEQGSHDELLALGGHYAALLAAQQLS